MQPKKGNLLLRPFAREMNMSSYKKGSCWLDPLLLEIMVHISSDETLSWWRDEYAQQ